jgi:hypothetical protein
MTMGFLSSFIEKTIDAVKYGKKLSERDIRILENVLEKRASAIQVASRAFAAAALMSAHDGKKTDRSKLKRLSVILDTVVDAAIRNSTEGKAPFSDGQRKKLVEVFNEMGFNGDEVASKFISNFDILHGEVLKENLNKVEARAEERMEEKAIPTRPQISSAEAKEERRERETERRA